MDKKSLLKSYRLQQAKIKRLKEMSEKFPGKEKEYKAQIKESIKTRKKIEKKINSIREEVLREVLLQKYICGKTNEEIGLILNYSTRHAERLHSIAIKKLKLWQIMISYHIFTKILEKIKLK